ncbi:MAG: pilus assembly protein PilM [Candidatus Omnitrophica bacterium]|nr:pilus assembly protein PilM [Candidatus Omnitrophota bacterium]
MSTSVAIEINKQYLKIIATKSLATQTTVTNCIVESISALTDEQIASRISGIIRQEKIKANTVSIAIPRDFVTVRNLHLPSQNPQEISQMIELHIARVVPYKREEIIFSYKLSGVDEMGYSKVILAIIQIDALRRQTNVLDKAGLFTDNIALSSYQSLQWILDNHKAEINQTDFYAILDIDSAYTDFLVFSKQGLLFSRNIPVGANPIAAKDDIGLMKLLGEIKQSLLIFYNEEANKKPAKIFLTGASIINELNKVIEKEIDIPVKSSPVHYFEELSKTKKIEIPTDVSMTSISEVCIDKGIHGLTFILPEIQIKKTLREKTKEMLVLGISLIYLFSIVCAIFLGKIYNQQTYLNRIDVLLGVIDKEAKELINQAKKTEVIKNYLSERKKPLFIMNQLLKVVPEEIALNFIGIDDKNTITLRGQAFQLSDVFRFINLLEKSNYFSDVQTKYTRKRRVKDKEITDFEIAFKLPNK